MMNYLEMLVDSAQRANERFERLFQGVTVEQANAFPVAETAPQIKSMTWLAWHTAKEMDFQIAELAGKEPIWVSQGWQDKFPFEIAPDEADFQHTLEQAQRIVATDLASLLGYLKAATEFTVEYLESLDEASLADVVDENWTPAVTRGVRLVSIIDDASMHSGQVVYARRLLGLKD